LLDGLSGRDGTGGKEKSLTPGVRHPRDEAKVLFPSRDFH
jgi:hypothetical protein